LLRQTESIAKEESKSKGGGGSWRMPLLESDVIFAYLNRHGPKNRASIVFRKLENEEIREVECSPN
jgi:hypothetical protein